MKEFYLKHRKIFISIAVLLFVFLLIMPFATTKRVKVDAEYEDKYDVALYIKTYNELPKNYITKGGNDYAKKHGLSVSGKIIGGDNFFDVEKLAERDSNPSSIKAVFFAYFCKFSLDVLIYTCVRLYNNLLKNTALRCYAF